MDVASPGEARSSARVPRIAASLAAIPGIAAYAWLSGAHLPSQRAAVMVSVVLLSRACGARLVSWNAVALAAIVVALLWPAAVTTASFALSFSCIGAIVLFASAIDHLLARIALPAKVREALALTLSTQIGVWPLTAATFGLIAPYAVIANAVVVPATGIAMVAGIVTLCVAHLPLVGPLAATVATWDVGAILATVQSVASLPGARLAVAPPPAVAIVAYDVAALACARLLGRRPALAVAILALAGCVVVTATLRPAPGTLTIAMLDVGQADGIVIRTPRGKTVLIDSGGRLERTAAPRDQSPAEAVGERVVLGYLRREGIRTIDLLVNTHPHGDHVGGCAPIVYALPVATIADSGQTYRGRAFRDCLQAARERGVTVTVARPGMRWTSGDGVSLDVLAPAEPFLADTGDDVNENSVVLRLTYRASPAAGTGTVRTFRAIFTGDAGEASEARLLASAVDVRADLLKVGHHGSRYASTPAFIAAVHPSVALISVGRHNTFGHPAAATLATLRAVGARVLRTDRCGAATVTVSVGQLSSATMLQCPQ